MAKIKEFDGSMIPLKIGDKVTVVNTKGVSVDCTVVFMSITCNKAGKWAKVFRAREISDEKNPWWGDFPIDDEIDMSDLPVAVGDTVMVVDNKGENIKCSVISISVTCNKTGKWVNTFRVRKITKEKNPWWWDYSFDDLKKTAFC